LNRKIIKNDHKKKTKGNIITKEKTLENKFILEIEKNKKIKNISHIKDDTQQKILNWTS